MLLAGAIALTSLGITGLPGWSQDFSRSGGSTSTTSTTSRGGCPNTPKPLKALLPTTARGGWTVEPYPTLWVYVPYTLTPDKTIEFVLRNEQNQEVYQTKIPGNGTAPGVVSLALPSGKMAALDIGKTYTWEFMVYCAKMVDRPAFVSGWVKRVAPDPALKKTMRSPQERSTLYANNLLWYDALTVLGEGLRAKPTDKPLIERWTSLLQLPSVGLAKFTTEPMTDCCTASSKADK